MIGIGMKKIHKISAINSVKVIVSPWQKGFTCGIIMDSKSKMTRFAEDKNKSGKDMTISSVAEFDDESNVIDFLEFLKKKRDKELN